MSILELQCFSYLYFDILCLKIEIKVNEIRELHHRWACLSSLLKYLHNIGTDTTEKLVLLSSYHESSLNVRHIRCAMNLATEAK